MREGDKRTTKKMWYSEQKLSCQNITLNGMMVCDHWWRRWSLFRTLCVAISHISLGKLLMQFQKKEVGLPKHCDKSMSKHKPELLCAWMAGSVWYEINCSYNGRHCCYTSPAINITYGTMHWCVARYRVVRVYIYCHKIVFFTWDLRGEIRHYFQHLIPSSLVLPISATIAILE